MSSVADGITRVLIADDDALVRLVVRAALESDGCAVTEADTSEAALTALQAHTADVAILDAHMPGSGLRALLEDVGALASAPPVIVMSGAPVAPDVLDSYRGGRSGSRPAMYLAKPVDLSTLVEAVRRLAAYDSSSFDLPDGASHAEP